ncbi:hypothetical protein [Clostridium sp. FP1]|uniref:hypothetical protein n=1 Tax=Clostridium sp. FP1 TaxID=2724076 RepID=UPI0013E9540E|nr:hypothetical protein [Clostridium sp. FP1]MBZ9635615.1 hypothetical protein [Clostridium sp. FP1]
MENKNKRNCNTCKHGNIFGKCETLKNNEDYQAIIKDSKPFDTGKWRFKDNFICDNYKCRYIEYPLEVSKINKNTEQICLRDSEVGKFAKIAPCAKEHEGKTYLGIYLGDLPIGNHISHNPTTKELNISFDTNPAIFVFDLNKIIYGCASWWSIIEKEEDLKDITNVDIENVWYIKALKSMSEANE